MSLRFVHPALRMSLLAAAFTLALLACKSTATSTASPGALKPDPRAEEAFRLAQSYYRVNNFAEALRFLAQANERPLNPLTTAALYLTARAHHNLGNDDAALDTYQRLIAQYPQSQYVAEANYHKGLLLLERRDQREAGLWLLLNLADADRGELKADAASAANQFLFETADADFLTGYLKKARPTWRPTVMEALAYRLQREGAEIEMRRLLADYQKSGGEITPRLKRLIGAEPTAAGVRGQLRIALVLPFMVATNDSAFDPTCRAALELLQGASLAIDSLRYPGLTDVELKVFDSADDSLEVSHLIAAELVPYEPHVVIGDLRNRPSRVLARAAALHRWLHLVPVSDSDEFLADKGSTMLVNPSQSTAAERLGEFIRRWRPGTRVLVAHDISAQSRRLADRFATQLAGTDVRLRMTELPTYVPLAVDRFKDVSAGLRIDSVDVVYLPLQSEELVSFCLFRLSNDSVNVQVLGTERWSAFRSLDPLMLSRLHAVFPSLYGDAWDDAPFERFRAAYLRAYKSLPTAYSIQGYDLARMLLLAIGRSRPNEAPIDALRRAPPFQGLNKRYRFGPTAADNQAVPLIEYRDGQPVRLPFGS